MKKIFGFILITGLLVGCNEAKGPSGDAASGDLKVGASTETKSVGLSLEINEVNESLDPKYEMDESELNVLLADGSITQEEYDELLKLTK